jgi:hypothetical protein
LVILDRYRPHFKTFRIDQQYGLSVSSMDTSGKRPGYLQARRLNVP